MRKAGAPIGSRNETKMNLKMLLQILQHPRWALAALELKGKLRFKNMEPYVPRDNSKPISEFIGEQLNGSLTWEYLSEIRKHWKGKLLLKGVMQKSDAMKAVDIGVDGIVVSNHGGRQFDGNPASISALPQYAKQSDLNTHLFLIAESGLVLIYLEP